MTMGIPAQDLPENQDPDVRYTDFHALGRRIELDEKGQPKEELGADGFPRTEDDKMATAPVEAPAPDDDEPKGDEGPGVQEMVGPEPTEPAAAEHPPVPLQESKSAQKAKANRGAPKQDSAPEDGK